MSINASLFAHIQNDSSLGGTYALEGNRFVNTVGYLNNYLDLIAGAETIPDEYQALKKQTNYLVEIEKKIEALWSNDDRDMKLRQLTTEIRHDLTNLPTTDKLLLPGGWHNSDGGHSIVYQFTRHEDGYHFTLYNAGDGLHYHAKKSGQDKELFNPTKTWHLPFPRTTNEEKELTLFIERLFKARLPYTPKYQKKPIDNKVLYEEILPSISFLGGTEIEGESIPEYGYTGGQLSGTCAQRAIHQMLKINSRSAKQYQRFIFKFKHHALLDYSNACLTGKEPFNAAVAEQIRLAIENNFKILNTPDLFSELEIKQYLRPLTNLQQQLEKVVFIQAYQDSETQEKTHSFAIHPNTLQGAYSPHYPKAYHSDAIDTVALNNGTELLDNLDKILTALETSNDPAARFYSLQQLLLELPINPSLPTESGFYAELRTMADFYNFQRQLNRIQTILLSLEKSWLHEEQIPLMNIMLQCLMSLHIDVYSVIPKDSNLPSFNSFSSVIMKSLLANQEYNAFNATNHPGFDKKLVALRQRFSSSYLQHLFNYYSYYNKILDTERELKQELKTLYQEKFANNITELHYEVRNNGLEALFMIAEDYNHLTYLPVKFKPLIDKVKAHLNHEDNLRALINPFYVNKYNTQFAVAVSHNSFRINSGLFPTFVPYELLLTSLPNYKYELTASPAKSALEADLCDKSSFKSELQRKTANQIQLTPTRALDNEGPQQVSQEDIIERDYFHLRSEPELQIALTLDYFNRNIERCADENNQRYIEANLFQPGLLLTALDNAEFLPQFDRFLQTGLRYYTENGQHTKNSVFYVRLNYLVSRYLSLNADVKGNLRLNSLQADLEKQLNLSNTPEVTYVLNQYLLLILIERINKEKYPEDLFYLAYKTYVYIQGHSSPQIQEDKSHRIEVESALARFKALISNQPNTRIEEAIKQALKNFAELATEEITIKGSMPVYQITGVSSAKQYEFNALTGKLYEGNFTHHNLPLRTQRHPLIKHLGLNPSSECLINSDESYMILNHEDHKVFLFHEKEQLIVQKEWTIAGVKEEYELQALSKEHQAYHANKSIGPIQSDLPKILGDGSMDFWRSLHSKDTGILVRNNVPVYAVHDDKIWALDETGNETGFQLKSNDNTSPAFMQFESDEFLLTLNKESESLIHLPRYNLNFTKKDDRITFQETGELVNNKPSPIHPSVAGLLLTHNEQARYLVPIARFFATETAALASDFYPVIHDKEGMIAYTYLQEHWKNYPPVQKPLWHYQNSEAYVSYQLKDGAPIADNVADALYLVYIYLATKQTEKAWKVLEECNTRLGGLTGDPKELQYIYWICKHLPHILPSDQSEYEKRKPIRKTPPYVACQLKAMSLLTDYLNQNGHFDLNPITRPQNANELYNQLEQTACQKFLTSLPSTIYNSFSRLQKMRRHLSHNYSLSSQERKHLLGYYHDVQGGDDAPKGALGAEWLSLNLESLLAERDALLARNDAVETTSPADKERLALIERHLKKLKPIMAKSSILELIAINLDLPLKSAIKQEHLKQTTIEQLEKWYHRVPGDALDQSSRALAIDALYSEISEDDFVLNFPAYFQQALIPPKSSSSTEDTQNELLRKKLMTFCTQTLIAARHIPLEKQDINIPMLCNMLYRVLSNPQQSITYHCKFNELVQELITAQVPPLKVYQAKDVYKDILVTPETVIAQQNLRPKTKPISLLKSPQESLIKQTSIESHIEENKEAILELVQHYQSTQEKSEGQLKSLEHHLDKGIKHNLVAEEEAGSILFNAAQEKRTFAKRLISTPDLITSIINASTKAQQELHSKIERTWTAAIALANEGPTDPIKARRWAIEQSAQSRPKLTQPHLLALYAHADLAYFIEKTGLSAEKAAQLHQTIHQALVYGIQNQAALKIHNSLEKSLLTKDPNFVVYALDLLARKELPGNNEPAMMLLQHEEQIVLHARQSAALSSLLQQTEPGKGFRETIEKIIMGGGKSKVVLPILAEKKAQGDNLVVIEVPQALLATNHVDLNRTSQRLFGKRAHRFEFNRDSDCSPKRLEQMYQQFTEIMTSRSYLVTTGEAIQSLELKYVELLLSEQTHDETWQQQIYWCDKITRLFRHHADCIIDEVHQGLSIKKKLNYTSGETKPLENTLIKNAIALYSFINQELIESAPSFDKNYDWTPFKKELATKLLNQASSPLYGFVSQSALRYGASAKDELLAYLTNKTETMPEAVLKASAQEQAALAFFKQEITIRLPQTLTQKLNKDYGASRRLGLSPVEQTVAIPYAASNVPNERNRFANELEALNKSIQMMLITGISKELLIERIVEWQALAHQELFQNSTLRHMDESPTAQGFALLTTGLGLKLSQINTLDAKQMKVLHHRLQFNRPLIFDCLRESSLKLIHQDKAIIPSDNFNHADQYRSVQGVSGTPPWNDMAYHERLHYDKTSSLGTDGYIFEVIRNKAPNIKGLDYQNATQFVKALLNGSTKPADTRAIIDIKGAFTGVSNLAVAQEIATQIKRNPSVYKKPLKHVLYFNENQVLCAIDIHRPNKPITLATSETSVLNRLLDSTPEERFTYFDQIHTTGTDITQEENTHALVLVDDKTALQEFLQGSMRLRQLELHQTMEIIVPERMQNASLDALYQQFKTNDETAVFRDAPSAAKGQMRNHLRRHFLSLIQDLPSEEAEKKAVLMKHFRSFFEDTSSLDLFALYGKLNKSQAIEKILGSYKEQLQQLWQQCLLAAEMKPYQKDIEACSKSLENVIAKALPFCLPEYESNEDFFALEVEVQKEVQKEVEVELLTLDECYDPKLNPRWPDPWPKYWNYRNYFTDRESKEDMTLDLNEICAKKNEPIPEIFSKELRASKNYTYTYTEQTQCTGVFLKPVFLVWYHLDKDGLHATLITPQEAKELKENIKYVPASWIATTDDTVLGGTRPESMLADPQYQTLREQVRFFNGEFNSLLNQDTPLRWITEEPIKKLTFFSERLMALRPGSASGFRQLQSAMTQGKTEGFSYISARPFEDLSQFNWTTIYPKTFPTQAKEYQKLAQAFVYLNKNWSNKTITVDDLQQQFDLPINSLVFIDSHLKHLMKLKELLNHLHDLGAKHTFLLALTEEQHFCLEQCINISINRLRETYRSTLKSTNSKQELSLASIHALTLLSLYPALKENKDMFNPYFETQARHADFKALLLALLDIANPSLLLLQNILENPIADKEVISKLLERNSALDAKLLLLLAKKCQTDEHFDSLLRQININEEVVLELLNHRHLKENHLNKLFNYVEKESSLLLIGQHPAASHETYTEILQHVALTDQGLLQLLNIRVFSKDDLLLILKHPLALSQDVLQEILKQNAVDETVLLNLITHAQKDTLILHDMIHHAQFTGRVAEELIKNAPTKPNLLTELALKIFAQLKANPKSSWVPCFDNLLVLMKKTHKTHELIPLLQEKQEEITPSLGVKIIAFTGEQMLNHLPLARIIDKANEVEIDFLTKLKSPYTAPHLKKLVQRITSTEQIDRLLKRKEMTNELADILLNKTNFNGKIGPWLPWLNQEQILKALNKTSDYSSLHYGLRNPQLSADARTQWLEQLRAEQKKNREGDSNKTPQQKLIMLIEELKIKAYQHAIKAIKDPNYAEAAETAFTLYQSLEKKAKLYFSSPQNYPNFRQECNDEIQQAHGVLAHHRGYKQILLDIVNVLLALVSVLINKDWRFFKANTASIEIVEDIRKNLAPNP